MWKKAHQQIVSVVPEQKKGVTKTQINGSQFSTGRNGVLLPLEIYTEGSSKVRIFV